MVSSGLVVSAAAAQAEDGTTVYVPAGDISYYDGTNHNEWHLGDGDDREESLAQGEDGLIVPADAQAQVLKGNGNDVAGEAGEDLAEGTSVRDVVASLGILATSTDAITYQIPIRIDDNGDGTWEEGEGWSTLRSEVGDPDGNWTTSQPIGDIEKGGTASLSEMLDEIGDNGYAIAVGFLVYEPAEEVSVTSFSANGVTTVFTEEPGTDEPGAELPDVDLFDRFIDVNDDSDFADEIRWMVDNGLTTGQRLDNGELGFGPKNNVSREAVAAFLYRLYGDEDYVAPEESPFADVATDYKFYKAIAWMQTEGHSTGYPAEVEGEKRTYGPGNRITREAFAAFIFRLHGPADYQSPTTSHFNDMKPGDPFYPAISWMGESGTSTGKWDYEEKVANYGPADLTTREATAAFLSRVDEKFGSLSEQ